jgi:hypothetical protein
MSKKGKISAGISPHYVQLINDRRASADGRAMKSDDVSLPTARSKGPQPPQKRNRRWVTNQSQGSGTNLLVEKNDSIFPFCDGKANIAFTVNIPSEF